MVRNLLFICLFIISLTINAQQISLTPIVTGLDNPIGLYFAPGSSTMYILQQRGKIRMADSTGTLSPTNFLDITSKVSASGNERGLLGLAFHPDYQNNGYFYVNYTKASGGNTIIARYSRSSSNPLVADPASEVILKEITQPYSNHNGGQLQIGPDGYLYIGMGDGGSANDPQGNGQNPLTLLGKMLRIDVNNGTPYGIPTDNPFATNAAYLPEIWATGVRNPWRFSFDKILGDLWIADVGQNMYEEVDFQAASSAGGENYGWRCYEGDNTFNTSGCGAQSSFTFPVSTYTHSGGNCSVTGGFIYRGARYNSLFGKYLYADYCTGTIWSTEQTTPGNFVTNTVAQATPIVSYSIVSFGEDHYGELYVVARDGQNTVYKLTDTSCTPAVYLYNKEGKSTVCQGSYLRIETPFYPGYTYSWTLDGNPLSSETNYFVQATQSGNYQVTVSSPGGCQNTSQVLNLNFSVPPVVSLSASVTEVCYGDSILLTTSPAGGILNGQGINGNYFNGSSLTSGSYDIIYTYADAQGCESSDTVTIKQNNCYLGINDPNSTVRVFPNPASDIISFGLPFEGNAQISLVNAEGRTVIHKRTTYSKGQTESLDISKLPAGMYTLRIQNGEKSIKSTIVISRK